MNVSTSGSFFELFDEEVEAIFRFHFSRGADWTVAQARTAETFIDALRLYHPRRIGPGRKRIWLWRIAVLARDRRTARLDGSEYSGDLLPSQEQMAVFARVAQAVAAFETLPRPAADSCALLWFAEMLPEEIGDILGLDPARVQEMTAQPEPPGLRKLIHDLQPVGFFTRCLEQDLRERAVQRAKPDFHFEGPLLWQLRYCFRGVMIWALRILVLLVMIYLLLLAWTSAGNRF